MNHPIKVLIVLLFISIGISPILAQKSAMSLEKAVAYALTSSPEMRDAQLAVMDAEAQIDENRARGLPQLNGSVNYQRYLEVPQLPLPAIFQQPGGPESISFIQTNNLTAAVNMQAMVFDGVFFVALKAAKAARDYAEKDLAVKQKALKEQVRDAYLPLLLTKANLDQLDKNIVSLEQLHQETKAIFEAGFAEQLDVDRLELSLANLKTERENLARQYQILLRLLKFTINFPEEDDLEIDDDMESLLAKYQVSNLEPVAPNYEQYPEIQLADELLNLQGLNKKAQKTAYLPSLNAFGGYQYQYQGDKLQDGFWAPTAFLGLQLNVPIYDGGYKRASIQRVQIAIDRVATQRNTLQRAIYLQITTAQDIYTNARDRLAERDKTLALAQRIYDTTQIKYREGVGSSLEVNQAEQAIYTAQTNRLQALYDLLKAKIDLQEALGKI